MSDDGTQAEELYDLRRQLADALQRNVEQQQAIADLGRRLEQSLSAGTGVSRAIGEAAPGSAADEQHGPSAVGTGTVTAGMRGEPPTLSLNHDNVFASQATPSPRSQFAQPTVEPVPSTRFVVQQAHELADFSLGGRQSLAQYLDRFEEHCAHVYAGSLDEALPLLKSKLSGPVRDIFVACGDIFGSYQTVKRRMTEWVERQEEVGDRSARDRFRCCRRTQGESLALYALRLASVFNDAFPDQDLQTSQALREHLLDNLPQRAADYLRRQMHYTREIHGINMTWRNLLSLLERERLDENVVSNADSSLFYTAEQESRSRPSRSSERRSPAPTAGPAGPGGPRTWRRREISTGGQRAERWRQRGDSTSSSSTTGEHRSMDRRRCYFCGHPGHLERECRRKQGLCFTCGRPGHYMRDCSLLRSRQRSQSAPRYRQVSTGGSQRAVPNQRQRDLSPLPSGGGRRMASRRGRRQQRDGSQGSRGVALPGSASSGTAPLDGQGSLSAEN